MSHSLPRVVILGRPNVGKSTLFNRLFGRRRALVHDEPGVTRDRLEEKVQWWFNGRAHDLLIVDTGGVGGDRFAQEIEAQVEIALSEANVVLVLFDGQVGLTPADREILRKLKQNGVFERVPIVGVVNKVDAEMHETMINEFYAAGLDELLTVSAEHGRGIDDLKMAIAQKLSLDVSKKTEEEKEEEDFEAESSSDSEDLVESGDFELVSEDEEVSSSEEEIENDGLDDKKTPRIAILGRPNVGKSTFVNALLGLNRMITSPIAGTTVDSIDSVAVLKGKPYVLIDTAGIRRKSKTEQGIEVLSVVQTRKALERADVAILMIDGSGEQGVTDQDEKIGGLIEEVGCGVIIVVNKWDLNREKPDFTRQMAADWVRESMGFLKYAPILFVSALEHRGYKDLGDLVDEILHQRQLKIPTHEFTEWVRREAGVHNPANAKFYLCHHTSRHPPTFVLHVNDPEKVHFSLRRHFVNALRDRWGFMGSPVRILFHEAQNRRSLPKSIKTRTAKTKVGVAAAKLHEKRNASPGK
ncbi:MAG: ribosome biogenesis GTPase Der [Bdellovibrionota bacterium]